MSDPEQKQVTQSLTTQIWGITFDRSPCDRFGSKFWAVLNKWLIIRACKRFQSELQAGNLFIYILFVPFSVSDSNKRHFKGFKNLSLLQEELTQLPQSPQNTICYDTMAKISLSHWGGFHHLGSGIKGFIMITKICNMIFSLWLSDVHRRLDHTRKHKLSTACFSMQQDNYM